MSRNKLLADWMQKHDCRPINSGQYNFCPGEICDEYPCIIKLMER